MSEQSAALDAAIRQRVKEGWGVARRTTATADLLHGQDHMHLVLMGDGTVAEELLTAGAIPSAPPRVDARTGATAPSVTVRTYRSAKEYQADLGRMVAQGWSVSNSVQNQPRTGCMRIIMLGGIGALIWKPKPEIIVTYTRA